MRPRLLRAVVRARGRLVARRGAVVGRGVRFEIARGARVELGERSRVGAGTRFHVGAGRVTVGADAVLGERCVVAAHELVDIGPGARLGAEVVLVDFDHDIADVERPLRVQGLLTAPIVIGPEALLDEAVGVLRGVTVGARARVETRAVVTHDVPPGARARGVPARVV